MKLHDYTTLTGFLPHVRCSTLEQAVTRLVDGLVVDGSVDVGADLVGDVMSRESGGSTAVGGGLIIPHARSHNALRLRIAVATLEQSLAVPSEDGRPVDVVILLVGPPGDSRQMLRLLARLARLVRRETFLDDLRAASTSMQLMNAFALAFDVVA